MSHCISRKAHSGSVGLRRTDPQQGRTGVACIQAFSGWTGVVSRDPCRISDLAGYGLPGGQKHLPEYLYTVRDLNHQLDLRREKGRPGLTLLLVLREAMMRQCEVVVIAAGSRSHDNGERSWLD